LQPITDLSAPFKRYLRCKATVTVGHIRRLFTGKLDLPPKHALVFSHEELVFDDDTSLHDVAYIVRWSRVGCSRCSGVRSLCVNPVVNGSKPCALQKSALQLDFKIINEVADADMPHLTMEVHKALPTPLQVVNTVMPKHGLSVPRSNNLLKQELLNAKHSMSALVVAHAKQPSTAGGHQAMPLVEPVRKKRKPASPLKRPGAPTAVVHGSPSPLPSPATTSSIFPQPVQQFGQQQQQLFKQQQNSGALHNGAHKRAGDAPSSSESKKVRCTSTVPVPKSSANGMPPLVNMGAAGMAGGNAQQQMMSMMSNPFMQQMMTGLPSTDPQTQAMQMMMMNQQMLLNPLGASSPLLTPDMHHNIWMNATQMVTANLMQQQMSQQQQQHRNNRVGNGGGQRLKSNYGTGHK